MVGVDEPTEAIEALQEELSTWKERVKTLELELHNLQREWDTLCGTLEQKNEEKVVGIEEAAVYQEEMLRSNNLMWEAKMNALEKLHRKEITFLEATIARKEEYHIFFQ